MIRSDGRRSPRSSVPPVGLAITFAAFDWLMSLQPLWFSSMFPVYVFAGGFSASIALLVPFVYYSVNVWRTMHPTTDVLPTLQPAMMRPFLWCLGAFFSFYVALLLTRVRLERSRAALDDAYLAMED